MSVEVGFDFQPRHIFLLTFHMAMLWLSTKDRCESVIGSVTPICCTIFCACQPGSCHNQRIFELAGL